MTILFYLIYSIYISTLRTTNLFTNPASLHDILVTYVRNRQFYSTRRTIFVRILESILTSLTIIFLLKYLYFRRHVRAIIKLATQSFITASWRRTLYLNTVLLISQYKVDYTLPLTRTNRHYKDINDNMPTGSYLVSPSLLRSI